MLISSLNPKNKFLYNRISLFSELVHIGLESSDYEAASHNHEVNTKRLKSELMKLCDVNLNVGGDPHTLEGDALLTSPGVVYPRVLTLVNALRADDIILIYNEVSSFNFCRNKENDDAVR